MANTQQAGADLTFSVASVAYGLIQSWSENQITERAEARGPGGHIVGIQEYNDMFELSLEYLKFSSGGSGDPSIGSPFTFNGRTWYIDSSEDGRSVDGFQTKSITAKSYPNLSA